MDPDIKMQCSIQLCLSHLYTDLYSCTNMKASSVYRICHSWHNPWAGMAMWLTLAFLQHLQSERPHGKGKSWGEKWALGEVPRHVSPSGQHTKASCVNSNCLTHAGEGRTHAKLYILQPGQGENCRNPGAWGINCWHIILKEWLVKKKPFTDD